MKSNKMHSLFLVLITAALLAACSAASPDKKTQLENLKNDAAKLNQQIQKLQSEISAESGPEPVKTKDVAIVSLKQGKFDHYVQTQGSIESIENIQVSSKTASIRCGGRGRFQGPDLGAG